MERPTLAPGGLCVGVLQFGHCLWVLGCHPSYGFSQVSRSSHYTTFPFTRTFTLYGASATGRVRAPQTIAGHTVANSTRCEPCAVEHLPEYSEHAHRCVKCTRNTHWFCPCCNADGYEGVDESRGDGFLCVAKGRTCYNDFHKKLVRTKPGE